MRFGFSHLEAETRGVGLGGIEGHSCGEDLMLSLDLAILKQEFRSVVE